VEQANLFADFNGLEDDFSKKVDFYKHEQHWTNRLILGDSLLVMTSLAEKERLKGRVQMIYLDPPYGIKFGSNWQVSTRKRDVKDGKVEDLVRQPEQIKAFRDTWAHGIHSYLTGLRDRLVVARDLLAESGSIFVQIGDENVHLVRALMDEVFGSENSMSQIPFATTTGTTGEFIAGTCDYLLWFAKNKETVKYRQLFRNKEVGGAGGALYTQVELADGTRRVMSSEEMEAGVLPAGARAFGTGGLTSSRIREARTGYFPITLDGKEYLPGTGEWKTNREGIKKLVLGKRISVVGKTPRYVRYYEDFPAFALSNFWSDVGGATDKNYVVQTATSIIQRLPAHDDRSRRPSPRSVMRLRHDGLCCRAMGPALDHHRHFARRACFGAHSVDGCEVSVLQSSPIRPKVARRKRKLPASRSRQTRHQRHGTSSAASSTNAYRTSRSRASRTTRTSRKACRTPRSTPLSVNTPTRKRWSISPTKTRASSAFAARSPSKACHPTAYCRLQSLKR